MENYYDGDYEYERFSYCPMMNSMMYNMGMCPMNNSFYNPMMKPYGMICPMMNKDYYGNIKMKNVGIEEIRD